MHVQSNDEKKVKPLMVQYTFNYQLNQRGQPALALRTKVFWSNFHSCFQKAVETLILPNLV